jgi:hypothetical protein
MLTKIKILSISVAALLLTIASTETSKIVIYPVSAQMDSNSNNNNVTKSTMDLAMSELARIHLMAANEALKGDTTAAFSQMNLAYMQFSMLGMKDMGRMNETQMMKFIQNGAEQSSSSSPSPSSASKMMVPENCIIIQGGVLQCRDILTGSYSLAK